MAVRSDYGLLMNQDAKLYRSYFVEMVKLHGVQAEYQYPINKSYSLHSDLKASNYSQPIKVGCIFTEHLDQKTAKKLGWDAELNENSSIIHVPYDLNGIQVGCLFSIPSAFDCTSKRLFRVVKMSATMIYPASIACEIVPEWLDEMTPGDVHDFHSTDFNLLEETN